MGGGIGGASCGGQDASGRKADGVGDAGDDEGGHGTCMEGAITGTAMGRGKGSKEFGVVREGVGLGGKELKEGEELGLEAIIEGGVPVKRWGRVHIGGKDFLQEAGEFKEFSVQNLMDEGRVANGLAMDAEAEGAFGGGGENVEGIGRVHLPYGSCTGWCHIFFPMNVIQSKTRLRGINESGGSPRTSPQNWEVALYHFTALQCGWMHVLCFFTFSCAVFCPSATEERRWLLPVLL